MANSLLHTAIIVEPDFATDVGKINLRVAQLVLRRHEHNNDDDNEFLACSLQPLHATNTTSEPGLSPPTSYSFIYLHMFYYFIYRVLIDFLSCICCHK